MGLDHRITGALNAGISQQLAQRSIGERQRRTQRPAQCLYPDQPDRSRFAGLGQGRPQGTRINRRSHRIAFCIDAVETLCSADQAVEFFQLGFSHLPDRLFDPRQFDTFLDLGIVHQLKFVEADRVRYGGGMLGRLAARGEFRQQQLPEPVPQECLVPIQQAHRALKRIALPFGPRRTGLSEHLLQTGADKSLHHVVCMRRGSTHTRQRRPMRRSWCRH